MRLLLLLLLGACAAHRPAPAEIPPVPALPAAFVLVRPLPAQVRGTVTHQSTKAELIAAAWIDTTTVHTALGAVDWPDGVVMAIPASFQCTVLARQLTVTYVRQGFETRALPSVGSCGADENIVRFRIQVEGDPGI